MNFCIDFKFDRSYHSKDRIHHLFFCVVHHIVENCNPAKREREREKRASLKKENRSSHGRCNKSIHGPGLEKCAVVGHDQTRKSLTLWPCLWGLLNEGVKNWARIALSHHRKTFSLKACSLAVAGRWGDTSVPCATSGRLAVAATTRVRDVGDEACNSVARRVATSSLGQPRATERRPAPRASCLGHRASTTLVSGNGFVVEKGSAVVPRWPSGKRSVPLCSALGDGAGDEYFGIAKVRRFLQVKVISSRACRGWSTTKFGYAVTPYENRRRSFGKLREESRSLCKTTSPPTFNVLLC